MQIITACFDELLVLISSWQDMRRGNRRDLMRGGSRWGFSWDLRAGPAPWATVSIAAPMVCWAWSWGWSDRGETRRVLNLCRVVQSLNCVWLCDPVDCSTPGCSVRHQLPELTQTRPLSWWCHPTFSSPSPALSLSQHQGLFQWVGASHQMAKVLELQLQHQSFQWIFCTDFI